MVSMTVTEGFVDFNHQVLPPDKPCKTWYRVVGDLSSPSSRRPLVALHGGPGTTHIYLTTPFDSYASNTNTPVVYYDQIGCGRSTHYREKRFDERFWTIDLFIAELVALLRHLGIEQDFDLYGHSWGAMLGASYAVSPAARGSGLNRLIIASVRCNVPEGEKDATPLIDKLPQAVQDTIHKYLKEEKYDAPEYQQAIMEYYKVYMCRLDPWPQVLLDVFAAMKDDDTTHKTMFGPAGVKSLGVLRNFDMSESCKQIAVPSLIVNGEFDAYTEDAIRPWFDGIPKAKWVVVSGAAHMAHLEKPERYAEIVWNFLK